MEDEESIQGAEEEEMEEENMQGAEEAGVEEENLQGAEEEEMEEEESMQGREDEDEQTNTTFLKEVQERFHSKYSNKPKVNVIFAKKNSEDLSWRSFIKLRFKERPQFIVKCCENHLANQKD